MILDITHSKLFNIDPDKRFAKEYSVPEGTWIEIWRRYKLLDYSHTDIKDYLFIKFARNLSYPAIQRWVIRTEIYGIANPLVKKGVVHVNSEIFREWEQNVMDELFKMIKSGASTTSKTII